MSALTQRPSWRALGRKHEDVKGFHLPELFEAESGHGEWFVAEGARNPRLHQEPKDRAGGALGGTPEEIVPSRGRVTDRQDRLRAV